MTPETSPRFDILPVWRKLNDMLVELVDIVPDDRLEWSPRPDLWSFERIVKHLADAREEWMTRAFNDGEPNTRVFESVCSKDDMKAALRATWGRVERTVADQARLDATYRDRWWTEAPPRSGHWVAFHLLEHDIHHRADLLLYLTLLGIETRRDLAMVD